MLMRPYFLKSTFIVILLSLLFSGCIGGSEGDSFDSGNNNGGIQQNDPNNNSTEYQEDPDAPHNVNASRGDNDIYVEVTWNKVENQGVSNYIIYSSDYSDDPTDESHYSKIAEIRSENTDNWENSFFRDTLAYPDDPDQFGGDPSVHHFYKVVAQNDYGRSPKSDYAEGWINYTSPVDTMRYPWQGHINSRSEEDGSLTIEWGTTDEATYNLYLSIGDTSNYTLLSENATAPYVATDFQYNTEYYYAVTETFEGQNESLRSDPLIVYTPAEPASGLKLSNIKDNQVTLSWNKHPEAIQYNILQLKTKDVDFSDFVSTPDTFYVMEGYSGNTELAFAINAYTNERVATTSDTVSGKTLYSKPHNISASSDQLNQITVTWSALTESHSEAMGSQYSIYRSTGSEATWMILDSTLDTNSFIDTSLIETSYHYQVVSRDQDGHSSLMSDSVRGTTVRFKAPTILEKDNSITGDIKMIWNKAPGATSYKVYRRSAYGFLSDPWEYIFETTDTTYLDFNTIDWLGYNYAVSSMSETNQESEKYFTNRTYVSIGDWAYIDIDLTADNSVTGEININWHATPNGTEHSYIILKKVNSGVMTIVDNIERSHVTWVDTDVTPGDSVQYVVDPVFDINGVDYKVGAINSGSQNNNAIKTIVN